MNQMTPCLGLQDENIDIQKRNNTRYAKSKICIFLMSFNQPYTEVYTTSVTRNIVIGYIKPLYNIFGKSGKEKLGESLIGS